MCIVATKHRKLLHEIDDVISMKNGSVCCETRTRHSKDEKKLNFPLINGGKVSLTSIFYCRKRLQSDTIIQILFE